MSNEAKQGLITAKELASLCDTDAKRMRSFIRRLAIEQPELVTACGQGNRYGFTPAQTSAVRAIYATSMRAHARQPQRSLADLEAMLASEGDA